MTSPADPPAEFPSFPRGRLTAAPPGWLAHYATDLAGTDTIAHPIKAWEHLDDGHPVAMLADYLDGSLSRLWPAGMQAGLLLITHPGQDYAAELAGRLAGWRARDGIRVSLGDGEHDDCPFPHDDCPSHCAATAPAPTPDVMGR